MQQLQPGDGIYRPVRGRKVFLSVPPLPESDPWFSSKDARVQVHWPGERNLPPQ